MVGGVWQREAGGSQLIKYYLIRPSPAFCSCSKRKSSVLYSAQHVEQARSPYSFGFKIPLAMSGDSHVRITGLCHQARHDYIIFLKPLFRLF